jgi:hypothetical protein
MISEEKLREKARLRAETKLGFYIHLAVYSGVNVLLFFIWWFKGGFPWFVFPLLVGVLDFWPISCGLLLRQASQIDWLKKNIKDSRRSNNGARHTEPKRWRGCPDLKSTEPLKWKKRCLKRRKKQRKWWMLGFYSPQSSPSIVDS